MNKHTLAQSLIKLGGEVYYGLIVNKKGKVKSHMLSTKEEDVHKILRNSKRFGLSLKDNTVHKYSDPKRESVQIARDILKGRKNKLIVMDYDWSKRPNK